MSISGIPGSILSPYQSPYQLGASIDPSPVSPPIIVNPSPVGTSPVSPPIIVNPSPVGTSPVSPPIIVSPLPIDPSPVSPPIIVNPSPVGTSPVSPPIIVNPSPVGPPPVRTPIIANPLPVGSTLNQISQNLASSNLSNAQQAYATLQQDRQLSALDSVAIASESTTLLSPSPVSLEA